MQNRGQDATKTIKINKTSTLGHNLHAIVGHTPQPLKSNLGILTANCEIYNWKELNKKLNIKTTNDAKTLLNFLDSLKLSEQASKDQEEIIKNLEETLKNPEMDRIVRSKMERKLKELTNNQITKR